MHISFVLQEPIIDVPLLPTAQGSRKKSKTPTKRRKTNEGKRLATPHDVVEQAPKSTAAVASTSSEVTTRARRSKGKGKATAGESTSPLFGRL